MSTFCLSPSISFYVSNRNDRLPGTLLDSLSVQKRTAPLGPFRRARFTHKRRLQSTYSLLIVAIAFTHQSVIFIFFPFIAYFFWQLCKKRIFLSSDLWFLTLFAATTIWNLDLIFFPRPPICQECIVNFQHGLYSFIGYHAFYQTLLLIIAVEIGRRIKTYSFILYFTLFGLAVYWGIKSYDFQSYFNMWDNRVPSVLAAALLGGYLLLLKETDRTAQILPDLRRASALICALILAFHISYLFHWQAIIQQFDTAVSQPTEKPIRVASHLQNSGFSENEADMLRWFNSFVYLSVVVPTFKSHPIQTIYYSPAQDPSINLDDMIAYNSNKRHLNFSEPVRKCLAAIVNANSMAVDCVEH